MTAAVLAVDGGNSKTDVALVAADGSVRGHVRGPGSSHQNIGIDASMQVLGGLIAQTAAAAGVHNPVVAGVGAFYLAGADFPAELELLRSRVAAEGWVRELHLDNDTFALLRAGTQAADRVAVVCGAGINCVGKSAAGGLVRFPSLGAISGDWGGGGALGLEALFLAVRAEDGRGEPTALLEAVASHFGTSSVLEVTQALHFGELPMDRLHELVPVLLAVADAGDLLAHGVVERLAEEVFLLARVALARLDLLSSPADVVLGGGVLAARNRLLLAGVARRLAVDAPRATIRVVDDPPVVGAALLGLDALGADPAVEARLRHDLLGRFTGVPVPS